MRRFKKMNRKPRRSRRATGRRALAGISRRRCGGRRVLSSLRRRSMVKASEDNPLIEWCKNSYPEIYNDIQNVKKALSKVKGFSLEEVVNFWFDDYGIEGTDDYRVGALALLIDFLKENSADSLVEDIYLPEYTGDMLEESDFAGPIESIIEEIGGDPRKITRTKGFKEFLSEFSGYYYYNIMDSFDPYDFEFLKWIGEFDISYDKGLSKNQAKKLITDLIKEISSHYKRGDAGDVFEIFAEAISVFEHIFAKESLKKAYLDAKAFVEKSGMQEAANKIYSLDVSLRRYGVKDALEEAVEEFDCDDCEEYFEDLPVLEDLQNADDPVEVIEKLLNAPSPSKVCSDLKKLL